MMNLSFFSLVLAFKTKKIDMLINNAGTGPQPGDKSTQGLEGGFGTMHLGHFALTKYLMPGLARSKGQARIVNVASHAGVANAQVTPPYPHCIILIIEIFWYPSLFPSSTASHLYSLLLWLRQIWMGADDIIKGMGDDMSEEWRQYAIDTSISWYESSLPALIYLHTVNIHREKMKRQQHRNNLLHQQLRRGRFTPSFFEGDGEGDLRNEIIDGGFGAYSRAKLSNILFTFELQVLHANPFLF